jgi:hypothetical protein
MSEAAGQVRLGVDGLFSGEGATLQEAADELVWKILVAAMALRSEGITSCSAALRPDMSLVAFLWELGDIAAAGGDIRNRLFSSSTLAA